MGTVTVPALLVLPKYWIAGNPLGGFTSSLWLDEWQGWQFCATVLPVALHRATAHRGGTLAGDFGELNVYLARLTPLQFQCFGAHAPGKPFPLGPFGQPVPIEVVYPVTDCGIDPADALSVVLTGDAMRAEARGDADLATVCGLGATLAGLVTGTVSAADPQKPGDSPFTATWDGIMAAAEAGRIAADDFPERLDYVPGFLNTCWEKCPELFKRTTA